MDEAVEIIFEKITRGIKLAHLSPLYETTKQLIRDTLKTGFENDILEFHNKFSRKQAVKEHFKNHKP